MGAVIPIVMICLAAASTTAAVIAAVETVTVLTIVLAAVAVAATAASVVFYVQGDIKNSMLFAGIGIAAGIGGVYAASQDAMSLAVAQMEAGEEVSHAAVMAAYESTSVQIWAHTQSIYASFSSFMEVIQFKAIMAIHQIAYLMSSQYRTTMDQLFRQIREVSSALGFGFDYMEAMIADARNMTLSVSAALGRSYDLAEVTWLMSYSDFLKHMSTQMHRYEGRPAEFLWDLNQMVVKPGVDTMATGFQAILLGTQRALEGAQLLAGDVVHIRNDLMKFVVDQPAIIRGQIYPKLKELSDNMDQFIRLSYDPAIKLLSTGLTALGGELTTQKGHISDIISSIRHPGSLMLAAESLPDDERLNEERAMYHMAFKAADADAQDLAEEAQVEHERIDDIIKPLKEITLIAPSAKRRAEFPVIESTEMDKKGKGPFVGDF